MTIRLLVADDDRTIAQMIQASLSRHGFLVDVVDDGAAAVERFQSASYDVVLLDARMPRLDGVQATLSIRTLPRGNVVGIAIMSAVSTFGLEQDAVLRRVHVDAFINKPFVSRELRERLAEIAYRCTGATTDPDGTQPAPARTTSTSTKRSPARSGSPTSGTAAASPAHAPMKVPSLVTEARAPRPAPPPPAPFFQTQAQTPLPELTLASALEDAPVPLEVRRAPELFDSGAVRIEGPHAVAKALLSLARARRTGVLELRHRNAIAELTFLRGLVVAAVDNLPENRLGKQLLRAGALSEEQLQRVYEYMAQTGERFAEAALATAVCDDEVLFDALDRQVRERAVCAVGWTEGTMSFRSALSATGSLSAQPVDALDAVVSWFLRLSNDPSVYQWWRVHAQRTVDTTPHLESGLIGYARSRVSSAVPAALFAGRAGLEELLRRASPESADAVAGDVYAMWVAEMIAFEDEAVDPRPVPQRLAVEDLPPRTIDRDAVVRVRREWLRARGRDHYDVLGVDPSASTEAVCAALDEYRLRFGRGAVDEHRLGPAERFARELWELVDDMEGTFSDPGQRAAYDAVAFDDGIEGTGVRLDAETALLEGKLALQAGDLPTARDAFRKAHEADPDDVEFSSYCSWTEALMASEALSEAIARLRAAAHAMPTATRPMVFLGRAALLYGDIEKAREHLHKAWLRCPEDPELREAMAQLPPAATPKG